MAEESLQAVPESKKTKAVRLTEEEKKTIPKEVQLQDDPVAIRAAAKLIVEHWIKGDIQIAGAHRNLTTSHMKHLHSLVIR